MRQYLLYSGSVHIAALAAILLFFRPQLPPLPKTSYTVDFISAAQTRISDEPAPIAAPPVVAAPQPVAALMEQPQKQDAAVIKTTKTRPPKGRPVKENDFALPAPSVLKNQKLAALPQTPAAQPTAEAKPAATAVQAAAPDTGGSAITAEFPNFPYPWYITQVRAALWNEWSSRMPRTGAISTVVGFKIKRDGKIEGAKVDKSSGNKLFDFAALSSAEQAAPFPPLPADYKDSTLSVHVEFKVGE